MVRNGFINTNFYNFYVNSDEMMKVNGVVPVLLRQLKIDEDQEGPTAERKNNVLEKIGEIHEIVIVSLFN